MNANVPQFPYGAVYFRKSNPPREDWERDYARVSKDGINIFRHWFMWGSIETAPGVFDWDDYDRQLDLAAKYGIKTIVAEISHSIPEWLAARYPELLPENESGLPRYPKMGPSSATGGFNGGLCLDKKDARDLTENFLVNLARRYRNHPAFLGFDVQNECTAGSEACCCDETMQSFRQWLKDKYGDLPRLKQAWKKYSYTSFEEIRYPAGLSFYPESSDWIAFRHDNFHKKIQWKIDILRREAPSALMCAHGIASTFRSRETAACDDWEAARKVEVYGFTWVASRQGNEPWRQFSAVDLTRAGSRGKPFWHAEAQGGPLWLQPQLKGRRADDGRVADEKDLRIWNFISMAGGARGILFPRCRPLLDGPLFGAFGPYEMDGSPTARSQMASTIAKWANAASQQGLMESKCVKGQIGIVYMPEASTASYLHSQAGNENAFYRIMCGAYQGFFDNNIQADFVHIDNIDEYPALYFPYPLSMTSAHAKRLENWVHNGGVLICEACPGYFGDELHAGTVQPNNGLDKVFGVRQKRVEFMPDILTDIEFEIFGVKAGGEAYLQTYELEGAEAHAVFEGSPIAASHDWGKGKTFLIGALLSGRYGRIHDPGTLELFKKLFAFTGQTPLLSLSNNAVRARMSAGKGKKYLWLLNPENKKHECSVTLPDGLKAGEVLWSGGTVETASDKVLAAVVEARDALVLTLDLSDNTNF